MSPSEELVLTSVEGGVGLITMNRPDAGNAMSLEFVRALSQAVDRISADPYVRCVLLTGSGRFFSVGGDINGFRSAASDVPLLLRQITTQLHAVVIRLVRMDKPLITAINGPAAGAGFGLAILGDIVIAADKAHFSMAYTAIGLTPDGGTSMVLPRLVGLRRAQDLAFTNRRVASAEALDIGLVTRVVTAEEVLGEAMAAARSLAAGPVQAYGTVRRLLSAGFEQPLELQLEQEADAISRAATSAEGKEGIAAFMEKRPPQFAPAMDVAQQL